MSVYYWTEHAARSADGAITHHYRLARHYVAHLVVVADELHWERVSFSVDFDADDKARGVHLISIGRQHDDRLRRNEHAIGDHLEIDRISDHRRKE